LFHPAHALQAVPEEAVVDRLLDECPGGACAHLTLVEGKERKTLLRLVVEGVTFPGHVTEEEVRALSTEFQRHGDEVLRGVLHDESPGGGLTGEGDLADTRTGRQRFAGLHPEATDD